MNRTPSVMRTVRALFAAPLLRGLAAYGSAEIATRIVRLVTVVIIARRIDASMIGVAALALSLFEVIRVLANAGIGQQIIMAAPAQLAATCNRAHQLFWRWCGLVAVIQLAIAAGLHLLFGQAAAALMLAVLAGVYLAMPAGLVQIYLLMRAGRMSTTARIGATQTLLDHVLTMLLVLAWPSAWAIVLPKLLTAPIWTLLVRRAMPWRADPSAGTVSAAIFVAPAIGVLGTELATAARQQLDKLLIGALLGVKALGLYYFAFNAGLGITTAFVSAFGIVLFPLLANAAAGIERAVRYRQALLAGIGLFLPVTLAQVLLAPIYVPLVFGARWIDAAPLVSILGMAALPLVAAAATTAWLRADGRGGTDAIANTAAGAAALLGLAMGSSSGLAGAAAGYAAGLAVILIPFAAVVLVRASAAPHMPEQFA